MFKAGLVMETENDLPVVAAGRRCERAAAEKARMAGGQCGAGVEPVQEAGVMGRIDAAGDQYGEGGLSA